MDELRAECLSLFLVCLMYASIVCMAVLSFLSVRHIDG